MQRTVDPERTLLLVLILLGASVLKFWFNPGLGVGTDDGNFYFQIATHVAKGDGFQTHVSMYNQALRDMPKTSTVPVVWPLLLGVIGMFVDLEVAAEVVPELLYLASLLALYILANRLLRRVANEEEPSLIAGGRTIDFGHFVVALFAFNPVFFQYTSAPFTEALGFLLLIVTFLLLDRTARTDSLLYAALTGIAAALAYLTRYQFFVVPLSIAVAIGVGAIANRRLLRCAIVFVCAAALPMMTWWIYLSVKLGSFVPSMIIDFAAYREAPHLPPTITHAAVTGFGNLVVDRLSGVMRAFDPTYPFSYVASFSAAAYLVPIALLLFLFSRDDQARLTGALRNRESVLVIAVVSTASLLLLMIHLVHVEIWLFGYRHGLHLIFLIIVATAYLIRYERPLMRVSVIGVFVLSIVAGLSATLNIGSSDWPRPHSDVVRSAAAWLDSRPSRAIVLAPQAQFLAPLVMRTSLHSVSCFDSLLTARELMRFTGATYVVRLPRDNECQLLDALTAEMHLVQNFGQGNDAVRIFGRAPVRTSSTDRRSTLPSP